MNSTPTASSVGDGHLFPLPGDEPTTRYGAAVSNLDVAAGQLRARAAAGGVTLLRAEAVDLAAAIVGADAWMWVCGAKSLRRPAEAGDGAVAALAAILARAAGHRSYVTGDILDELHPALSPDAVALVEAYRTWLAVQLPEKAVSPAMLRIAADLCAGREHTRLPSEVNLVRLGALFEAVAG